jgi:hypothetical protein
MSHASFLEQLKRTISSLEDMKPDDVHVLTVHANYGNYEIVIGPENHHGGENDHSRSVEINGEIHHLFITPDDVTPNPSHNQVHDKLKNTVIMQNLSVHLRDDDGDGEHAVGSSGSKHGVEPRGMINMAGAEGEEIVHEMEESGKLNDITYHIIQEDILHALDKRRSEEEPTIEL